MNRLIEILTSFEKPTTVCPIGNVGIARAAIEKGIHGVFSYPGTPSTEISEVFSQVSAFQNKAENQAEYPELCSSKIYFEYSINEKVALEKAIAFSIGNRSAMCIMKNVGMNVASDALITIPYQSLSAPLVIVICDDPGCHSSSNEQDSRYWAKMASVPLFNPSTPEQAMEMTKAAFNLSGITGLPVILRTTTRVSHCRAKLTFGKITVDDRKPEFVRVPEHINIPARTATAHQKLLQKMGSEDILTFSERFSNNYFGGSDSQMGIVSSGVATAYLRELIAENQLANRVEVLDLGLISPFPESIVRDFLRKGFSKLLVLEELDPIIETAVRDVAQKEKLTIGIYGKGFSELTSSGEFSLDMIKNVLDDFSGIRCKRNPALKDFETLTGNLPPRPPVFCSGCPHRATYYSLKLLIPRDNPDYILCGDIGCFGLGALPPFRMIDTVSHMGMSISMAQGLSVALKENNGKVIALQGDGTFFHSGIPSLLNAIYTNSNMLLIIFDNCTIGMTGQQNHPGAVRETGLHEVDLPALIKGLGVEHVDTLEPFNIRESFQTLEKALQHQGIAVLISKAPCVFLPAYSTQISQNRKVVVDPAKCNTCHNQPEDYLRCSRNQNPASSLKRATAKIKATYAYHSEQYACPANICNLGFFHSLLEDDPKTALNMVRDKLLFSRTCGDLCHRPCELFSASEDNANIPIKSLKKYASAIEENFRDFSLPIGRVKDSDPKNINVAIVGAGPAGLSAAYDLVREGYKISVFEKESAAGGIIQLIIPDFRMDKKAFTYEIAQLEKMGVEFNFNTSLGKDISIEDLQRDFDSVILATGLWQVKSLEIIEEQLPANKWADCLRFLQDFNSGKLSHLNNSSILVVGGGNSAMDAARAARRLHHGNKVVISCLEEFSEMPAFTEEIRHTRDEGIVIMDGTRIESCSYDKEIAVRIQSVSAIESPGEMSFDFVVIAIGQCGNPGDFKGLEECLGTDQRIVANLQTAATAVENIFVAGDLCDQNHMSLIGAIASGKRAAIGIRKIWENYPHDYEALDVLLNLNQKSPSQILTQDIGSDQPVAEYLEQFNIFASCAKCNHCIDHFGCPAMIKVNGKIVIEEFLCTRCGLCIDVCPNDAIRWE